MRRARVWIEHLFGVVMVGGDEQNIPRLFPRGVHRPDRYVCFANRFRVDGCGVYLRCVATLQLPQRSESTKSGQTNHIERCKITHHELMFPAMSTSETLSGSLSYVATLGDGIMWRPSASNSFSSPPLKKNLMWAYFSVSADAHWQWCWNIQGRLSRPKFEFPFMVYKYVHIFYRLATGLGATLQ